MSCHRCLELSRAVGVPARCLEHYRQIGHLEPLVVECAGLLADYAARSKNVADPVPGGLIARTRDLISRIEGALA
jgi:hypothetical protein